MQKKDISLTDLFFTFAKIGAMTFGGGYAMLPIIDRELIEKKSWVTHPQLMDYYSIGQVMPGVIAVNVASLVGYKTRGTAGAVTATFGVVLPSLITITVIAAFLQNIMESPLVLSVFAALQVCVAALVINAVIPFFKRGITNVFTVLLFIMSFCGFFIFDVSPAYIVFSCALAHIIFDWLKGNLK